jgi:hypothetical protein
LLSNPSRPALCRCALFAGLQIRFFCGISNFCRYPSAETLQRALSNVEQHFAAVVVVDEMELSFQVLEATLPSLFRGLSKRYAHADRALPSHLAALLDGSASLEGPFGGGLGGGGQKALHARANGAAKASGGALQDPLAKAFVLAVPALQLEYQLYNFTVERLHAQARACQT